MPAFPGPTWRQRFRPRQQPSDVVGDQLRQADPTLPAQPGQTWLRNFRNRQVAPPPAAAVVALTGICDAPALVPAVATPTTGAFGLAGTLNPATVPAVAPPQSGLLGLTGTLAPAVIPAVTPAESGGQTLTGSMAPATVPQATPQQAATLGLTGIAVPALVALAAAEATATFGLVGTIPPATAPTVTPAVTGILAEPVAPLPDGGIGRQWWWRPYQPAPTPEPVADDLIAYLIEGFTPAFTIGQPLTAQLEPAIPIDVFNQQVLALT